MTLKKTTFRLDSYTLFIETGFYYLQSRYYDPIIKRFLNADSYGSTGQGYLGYNMFVYCRNNPIRFLDNDGFAPVDTIDIDGDGRDDCYIYEYSFDSVIPIGIVSGYFRVKGSGRIYIYNFLDMQDTKRYIEDENNRPEDFKVGYDFVVGDYTAQEDANIQVRDSYKCGLAPQMRAITDTLLEYGEQYAPNWKRTQGSLITEWQEHNTYSIFSNTAKHVDFNNKEEGKGSWYYFKKAIAHALGIRNDY